MCSDRLARARRVLLAVDGVDEREQQPDDQQREDRGADQRARDQADPHGSRPYACGAIWRRPSSPGAVQPLAAAQQQHAVGSERRHQRSMEPLARGRREVDRDVAAQHEAPVAARRPLGDHVAPLPAHARAHRRRARAVAGERDVLVEQVAAEQQRAVDRAHALEHDAERVQLRAVAAARRPRRQPAAARQQRRQQLVLEQRELLGIAEQRAVRDRDRAAKARAQDRIARHRPHEARDPEPPVALEGPAQLLVDVLGAEVIERQAARAGQRRELRRARRVRGHRATCRAARAARTAWSGSDRRPPRGPPGGLTPVPAR